MPRRKKVTIPVDIEIDLTVSDKRDKSMTYIIICDGSGSMGHLQGDVVKGLNKILADAKADQDDSRIWMTTFDTRVNQVFENAPAKTIRNLTQADTFLGGGTALLDAIGETLTKAQRQKLIGKKTVVIYTDGEENSSKTWDNNKVKALIETLQGKDWTFIFMSADVNNFSQASAIGISRGNYLTTTSGTTLGNFAGLRNVVHEHKFDDAVSTNMAYVSASIDASAIAKLQEEEQDEE